jgi:hypothetical protein
MYARKDITIQSRNNHEPKEISEAAVKKAR